MSRIKKDWVLPQIMLMGLLAGVGALVVKEFLHPVKSPEQGDPNRDIQEQLIAAYISEHQMLWGEIVARLAGHKTVLNISVTALAALITISIPQTGWRDALLAGPVLGFLSTAMLLRQWQGWTMVAYYFQQKLQPGYLTALRRLGGQKPLELDAPPLNWITYVNARSGQQPFGHRLMLRFLWFSDYLLPMLLGIACLIIFALLEPGKLYFTSYQMVLFADIAIVMVTLWLYLVFRRWRRLGFSSATDQKDS